MKICRAYRTACVMAIISLSLSACSGDRKDASEAQQESLDAKDILEPEQLITLFPDPPAGFSIADTRSLMDTATGDSIANAALRLVNSDSAEIIVTLSDYFYAREFYKLATGLWTPELSFEDGGNYARELRLPEGQSGWESFDVDSRQGTMLIGVKDRYLVSCQADGLDDLNAVRAWMSSGWMDKLP